MKSILALLIPAATLLAADVPLGKPLTLKEPLAIATLMASPDSYVGKMVQVRGKVTEVCEMAGCWMNLVDPEQREIRVKVKDGEIVFPKTAVGKMAIAEGKLTKIQLTKDQMAARAKHDAEERGKTFDPSSVKRGGTIYQLAGTGAVISE